MADTTGHEGGHAFNEDQRASHPEPFVFLDVVDGRPYKAQRWDDEWWLFYWHPGKSWVSLRKASGDELRFLRQRALPPDQAKLYDDLHAKHHR